MSTQTLSQELNWRGQIKDKTFSDITWLDKPGTFYLGTDAGSSDSLTIGNLAIYMLARRLRKHGWKAVLLFGGATSLIGDPGGKKEERELQSKKVIDSNIQNIEKQVKQLFSEMDFQTVNNYDWFKDIGYLDFLREVGKHYSMTELLQREFISARIGDGGTGISYAEFSYSLIQGYDYWHLNKHYDVNLQIGGSDQWGNMLSGVPLIRKKEDKEVHALSMPLVVNSSTGQKFGKSEEGAVWLDSKKTSVYKFYQFWLNIEDENVENYLKIYTELNKSEIEDILQKFHKEPSERLAQKTLAFEVTKIVHGEDRAESVKKVSEVLFGSGDYKSLESEDFNLLKEELKQVDVSDGVNTIDLLNQCELASSNSEARRFLDEKSVYLNGKQIEGSNLTITNKDSINGWIVVRRGKNSMSLARIK